MNNSTKKTPKKTTKETQKKTPKKVPKKVKRKLNSKFKYIPTLVKLGVAGLSGAAVLKLYLAYLENKKKEEEFKRNFARFFDDKLSNKPKLPEVVQSDINEILNAKSQDELKKLCNKKYLKYHPDKQPDKELSTFFINIKENCDTMMKKF